MRRLLTFLFWLLGIVAIIGVALRATVFDVWRIPDDRVLDSSLRPTLAAGDLVLLYRGSAPAFANLVRCFDPEDQQRFVVGRVVGLGGDHVKVDGHRVMVNGKRYEETVGCDTPTTVPHPTSGSNVQASCERVQMGGSWHMRAFVTGVSRNADHQVGEGRIYLLSDNRSYHDDSRDFGAVPDTTCGDRIVMRLWSSGGLFAPEGILTGVY